MRYFELLPHHFLTVEDLRDMTEFPTVAARTDKQLGLYVTRAHILLENWLPYDDRGQIDRFEQQMQVATFMTAEGMALANPTRAAAAAGITAETIGKYSYSRAPGGASTGTGVKGDLVPDEAIFILERWSLADDDVLGLTTTEVFPQAAAVAAGSELRRFGLGDDLVLSDSGSTVGWADLPGVRG